MCKKGAPAKLSSHDVAKILKVAEAMIKKANGQQEITLPMILQKAGHDVSETTVRKHFKKQKIAFFKLKEKPMLEMGDLEERITSTKKGSITSFQALYVPADDYTDLVLARWRQLTQVGRES